MRKTLKRILVVTDDFDDEERKKWKFDNIKKGDYFFHAESNWLKFEFVLVETLDRAEHLDGYDAILIDYGVLEETDIPNLQKLFLSGAKMAWFGALGGCGNHYNENAKKTFPRLKFLHNWPWW